MASAKRIALSSEEALWLFNILKDVVIDRTLKGHHIADFETYAPLLKRIKDAAGA